MGTTLTGTTPQDTYDSLIKVTDNGPLSGSLKKLTDGLGNDSSLSLSTTAASLSGTLAVTGNSTLADLDLSGSTPSLDFVFAPNTAFKHTIIGANYSSSPASSNYMTFKVASAANTQVDVMTLNGAGNVGIGTSSPGARLDARLTTNTNSSQKITRFAANNASGELKAFDVSYTGSANLMTIGTAAVGTDPSISVNVGSTEVARFTTNGLTFNGDTAAANALDDYEEGTWTMGISFGGASVGVTYTANTGTYTKIGRQVTVNGNVILSSKGSSTGAALITGLPFASSSLASFRSASSLRFSSVSFANAFQAPNNPNTTTIALSQITEAGADTVIDDTQFSNTSNIIVSMTYFV